MRGRRFFVASDDENSRSRTLTSNAVRLFSASQPSTARTTTNAATTSFFAAYGPAAPGCR